MRNLIFTGLSPTTARARRVSTLLAAGTVMPIMAFSQTTATSPAEPVILDEIIVSARKIQENVQDIPMSVQVLSADALAQTDLTRMYDLQFNIPGLVVNNLGLNGAGFSLRGVADQGGSGISVATNLNGVYQGNSSLAIARMFDLDQVEVLKGPQGTLYGRNATGGSINFSTHLPESDFSADIEAAHGSFDTSRVQGHVNLPFERTALRLAYIGSEGDGFIRNSIDDRTFSENDFWGARGSLLVDASDNLQLTLIAQHVEDDGASGELWLPSPAFLADPSDIRLTTVTLSNPFLKTESDNVSVDIKYTLGLGIFHSITGYARNQVQDRDDCAGLPILRGCVRATTPADYDQWSQEFQLASHSGGSFDWLVGIYYFDSNEDRNYYQLTPVLDPNPTNDYSSISGETAYAFFGQTTWYLAERWSVTGGLRLNHEESRLSTIGTGTQDSPTLVSDEQSWNNQSWRLDLRYTIDADLLAYASLSTGFKSGGLTSLPGGELDSYGPEDLTAYEAGLKSQWLDRRATVNGSVFYYDFRDLQVSTYTVSDNVLVFETDNAARAKIYGVDTDGIFRVSEQFSISGGVVWLPKREFIEYRNDQTGDTLSGNQLTRAPEWSATAAITYDQPLRDLGNISARLEYNYRSDFFYTTDNNSLFAQDSFGLLNVFLDFQPTGQRWHLFASGRNLGNADYFNQVFLQSSPGYPDTYEAGFGVRF